NLLRGLAHLLQPRKHEGHPAARRARQLLEQFLSLPLVQEFHPDRRPPPHDVRLLPPERPPRAPPWLPHSLPVGLLHRPCQRGPRSSPLHVPRPRGDGRTLAADPPSLRSGTARRRRAWQAPRKVRSVQTRRSPGGLYSRKGT